MGDNFSTRQPPEAPGSLYYGPCDANGVDLSLLEHMLNLSPIERLRLMDAYAREIQELLEYGRESRASKTAESR